MWSSPAVGGCDLLVGAALDSPQAMSSPLLCQNHSSALDTGLKVTTCFARGTVQQLITPLGEKQSPVHSGHVWVQCSLQLLQPYWNSNLNSCTFHLNSPHTLQQRDTNGGFTPWSLLWPILFLFSSELTTPALLWHSHGASRSPWEATHKCKFCHYLKAESLPTWVRSDSISAL